MAFKTLFGSRSGSKATTLKGVSMPVRPSALRIGGLLMLLVSLGLAAGCAPVIGYPADPDNTDKTLDALTPYFSPDYDKQYNTMPHGAERQQLRDLIVLSRTRAYNLEFDSFERRLNGDGNAVSAGGDLVLLTLAGLIATTGNAGTKAALGAASAGVLGAQAAINKDLYYQRTLPALLAQLEANRAKATLTIMQGLNLDDSKYSLAQAELDLDTLKRSGGIPTAIGNITQQAETDKANSQASLDQLRTLPFNTTSSTTRLMNWLDPNGKVDPVAMAALQAWQKTDSDPNVRAVPAFTFVTGNSPGLEAGRQRALASKTLNIP